MTDAYLMRKYGITLKMREAMFKKQKGKCAICEKPESYFKKRLAVDHDHSKSKKVRGLLCFFCNRWRVGKLNLYWAEKVYLYLKKYG